MEKNNKNTKGFVKKDSLPTEEEMFTSWDNIDDFKDEYPKPDLESVWDGTKEKIGWNPKRKINLFGKSFFRYAAAILLPALIIGSGVYYSVKKINSKTNYITYNSPDGMRSKISLPDGSTIWLQPNSQIKYPEKFTDEYREVEFSGKAYFKISKNPDKPFIVHASNVDISVLGTQFYVKANPEKDLIETGLVSGSVKVSDSKEEKILSPNDVVVFSKSLEKIVESRNLSNTYHWENGSLVFENCSFNKVLAEISEWYGYELKTDPKLDLNVNITLTIREESIHEILDILKIIVPFKFQVKQNKIEIYSAT